MTISPAARVRAPARSKGGAPGWAAGGRRSRQYQARIRAAAIKGIRPQNTHSQPRAPTRSPAPRVPPTMPRAWLAAVKPIPKPRRWAGNRLAVMAGATA